MTVLTVDEARAMHARHPEWEHAYRTQKQQKQHDALRDTSDAASSEPSHIKPQVDTTTEQREGATHSAVVQPELFADTTSEPGEPKRKSKTLYVKAYPGMAAWALREKHVNALALWTLARAFDVRGQGRLTLAKLRAKCKPYLRGDRFRRALRDAEKCGMLLRVRRQKDNAHIVELRSNLRTAKAIDIESLGAYPVLVNANHIKKIKVFKARLLAAWHKGKPGDKRKPGLIARATIKQLTGVSPSGQRAYERRANIRVKQNIGLMEIDAKDIKAVMNGHKKPFRKDAFRVYRKDERRVIIGIKIQNSYSSRMQKHARGNIRRVNSALRGGLVLVPAGQHVVKRKFIRGSFNSQKEAIACMRKEDKARSEGGSGLVGREPWARLAKAQRRTNTKKTVFWVLPHGGF